MKQVMEFIANHGLDTLLIAVVTTIATGIIKFPIKKLAQKAKNSHAFTRFITFLPVFVGFGATALGSWLIKGKLSFAEQEFYIQWLSSVSLSLAIYAFWEKFVPSKSKILSEAEIADNQALVEELRNIVKQPPEPMFQVQKETSGSVAAGELQEEINSLSSHEASNATEAVTEVTENATEQTPQSRAERIILTGGNHVKTAN